MVRDSKVSALASVRLFSSLSRRELARVARASDAVEVPAGNAVVAQDRPGHELYLILDGSAVVRRNGRRAATLGAGDYFGELAILDGGPRSASVEAATDLRLLVIGQRSFSGVLDEIPAVARKLLVGMAARLRDADAEAYAH